MAGEGRTLLIQTRSEEQFFFFFFNKSRQIKIKLLRDVDELRSEASKNFRVNSHLHSPTGNPCCCLLICSWPDAFSSYVVDEILKSSLPTQRWGHNAGALSVSTHTQQTNQTVMMMKSKSNAFLTNIHL